MRTEPLLLVLDEPTSSLDPEAEEKLFDHAAPGLYRIADRQQRAASAHILAHHRLHQRGVTS